MNISFVKNEEDKNKEKGEAFSEELKEDLRKKDNLREKCEAISREQDFGISESIEKQLEKIEKENESLELVQKKETEIEDQTEEESLQKEHLTILDEKEEGNRTNLKMSKLLKRLWLTK